MTNNSNNSLISHSGGEQDFSSDESLILNTTDILPGDVLLYRPRKPNIIQRKISSATSSPYTHAAIYIGNDLIAESVSWPCLIGVRKQALTKSMHGSQCVGVLRSQLGFGGDRPKKLDIFVATTLRGRKFYNLIAAYNLPRKSKEHFENQVQFIRENYGKATSHENFAERSFFCSAYVVACYSVVGIIGGSAQVAYEPDFFSPGGLYKDPTFGWLLGYLLPNNGSIPDDDPLLSESTLWRDCQSLRWW